MNEPQQLWQHVEQLHTELQQQQQNLAAAGTQAKQLSSKLAAGTIVAATIAGGGAARAAAAQSAGAAREPNARTAELRKEAMKLHQARAKAATGQSLLQQL